MTTVNGSTNLTVEACENYEICNNIRISNPVDQEWLDSVKLSFGNCYTNITNLTPDNGVTNFYNSNGTWDGTYLAGDSSIFWKFTDPIQQFGDGQGGVPSYSCAQGTGMNFDFCFNADIALSLIHI